MLHEESSFEASPFEFNAEFGNESYEWGRGRQAPVRRASRRSGPPPKPGRLQVKPRRPSSKPSHSGPHPRIYGQPQVVFAEPLQTQTHAGDTGQTFGTEHQRWIQDCLNRALGMQLPITGVMGPETRSAVRTFQQQQGLRASGIVGPDTEAALKTACENTPTDSANDGDQTESELGPLNASLTWLPNNGKPTLFTRDQASKQKGGGVYIVVESHDGVTVKRILKVGKTADFARRFGSDQDYKVALADQTRGPKVPVANLRFYLGQMRGVDRHAHVERALARLLFRTGETLVGGQPVRANPVQGKLRIQNILPGPLQTIAATRGTRLDAAYRAAAGRDSRGQQISAGSPPVPNSPNTLTLDPKSFPNWEISPPQNAARTGNGLENLETTMHAKNCYCPQCQTSGEFSFGEYEFPSFGEMAYEAPFSEAEEMDLAAELLSVASEEELDLFLGKLVKGAFRGLKKVGRFASKIAKPLGGVLKGVAKAALPFVGGALGSFIPIPGVGTALGSALGGALSKALEMELGELSQDEQEFEIARRFVRLAGTAARQAAQASPDEDEQEMLEMALIDAARRHLPKLPPIPYPSPASGQGARTGRWVRRSNGIVVFGA